MNGDTSIVSGVSGRYATALFELALEEGKVDAVSKDIDSFDAMVAGSEDLKRLVTSPAFTTDEQKNAVEALIAKAKITGSAANFLRLLAKNRRLSIIRDVARALRALVSQHRGEISADVVSAAALTAAQVKALKAELKKAVGKDVSLNERVDPSLIGGLIVKVGSRMVDTSVRTKLDSLKLAMKEVG